MRRTVGNLFGFSEEIVRPAIKNHASDYLQGHQFFGNQLGRVQMIERKSVSFRSEGNLFGFSEEIVRPAIKNHASDYLQGHQFFGNQLGRVQMIERKSVSFLLREKLHREFPLREISRCDGLEHIAAVEVLISTGNLDGLIPNRGLQAELGTPVEFDEG